MSKKYIESMNKITVDDKLKKRILEKVKQESIKENNVINIRKNRNLNKFWSKSIGITAACCAFVVCTSLSTKFPELFNKENASFNNREVEKNDHSSDNNSIFDENNKSETVFYDENISINTQEIMKSDSNSLITDEQINLNNIGKENESNNNGQVFYSEKNTESLTYKETEADKNQNSELIDSENNKNEIINDNKTSAVDEKNDGKEYFSNDVAEASVHGNNDGEPILSSSRINGETFENTSSDLKIPKALEDNYEITYTLLVSDDEIEVGYKDKEREKGILKISSVKNDDENKGYDTVKTVETSKGSAVFKVNENKKEKCADWKYDNKYYSLHTKESIEDSEVIFIIESCR